MAKTVSADDAILAALGKAVGALPEEMVLLGTGGLFNTKPEGKRLAEVAVERGLLAAKEVKPPKGKAKVYGVLTDKGLRAYFDSKTPKAAVEALIPLVQALNRTPSRPDPETNKAELARASEACVSTIRTAFAGLEAKVLDALTKTTTPTIDAGPVLNVLRETLARVEAPALPKVAAQAAPPGGQDTGTADAVVAFVEDWARRKSVGCQLDVLWDHLVADRPRLSIGTFHDTLRGLHEAGRIRLSGWPGMLDDIPRPNLALFVASKVMYYAQPARPHA